MAKRAPDVAEQSPMSRSGGLSPNQVSIGRNLRRPLDNLHPVPWDLFPDTAAFRQTSPAIRQLRDIILRSQDIALEALY